MLAATEAITNSTTKAAGMVMLTSTLDETKRVTLDMTGTVMSKRPTTRELALLPVR